MAVHQSLQCWLTDSVLCVCGLPDGAGGAEPCPCGGSHNWLVPAMLAPPESLLISCIRRENFMEAHQVCGQTENRRVPVPAAEPAFLSLRRCRRFWVSARRPAAASWPSWSATKKCWWSWDGWSRRWRASPCRPRRLRRRVWARRLGAAVGGAGWGAAAGPRCRPSGAPPLQVRRLGVTLSSI